MDPIVGIKHAGNRPGGRRPNYAKETAAHNDADGDAVAEIPAPVADHSSTEADALLGLQIDTIV